MVRTDDLAEELKKILEVKYYPRQVEILQNADGQRFVKLGSNKTWKFTIRIDSEGFGYSAWGLDTPCYLKMDYSQVNDPYPLAVEIIKAVETRKV